MLKHFTLGSVATIAMTKSASASWMRLRDGSYTYVPDDSIVLFLIIAGIITFFVCGLYVLLFSPPPPKKTADEYNADAVLRWTGSIPRASGSFAWPTYKECLERIVRSRRLTNRRPCETPRSLRINLASTSTPKITDELVVAMSRI